MRRCTYSDLLVTQTLTHIHSLDRATWSDWFPLLLPLCPTQSHPRMPSNYSLNNYVALIRRCFGQFHTVESLGWSPLWLLALITIDCSLGRKLFISQQKPHSFDIIRLWLFSLKYDIYIQKRLQFSGQSVALVPMLEVWFPLDPPMRKMCKLLVDIMLCNDFIRLNCH